MNCKPGDLAVVVRAAYKPLIGKFLHIKAAAKAPGWWMVEMQNPLYHPVGGMIGAGLAPDDCLRPIRDPGDDAVDETLLWKRIPQPTGELV